MSGLILNDGLSAAGPATARLLFAQDMVAELRALLLKSAGMKSINVDGQSVSYDDLEAKLAYWERQVDLLTANPRTGKRRGLHRIDLGGCS